ncbi:unnamed protein product [Prorocentrum cordatum]|uniref:Uncharacterized protein n=1 Tax=Prorocentrum cordatum TaxID=2364126 RepID=A0ABN9UYS3_9DINO|nr:unnamed protein product [Polarella glacialis]
MSHGASHPDFLALLPDLRDRFSTVPPLGVALPAGSAARHRVGRRRPAGGAAPCPACGCTRQEEEEEEEEEEGGGACVAQSSAQVAAAPEAHCSCGAPRPGAVPVRRPWTGPVRRPLNCPTPAGDRGGGAAARGAIRVGLV